MKTILFVIIFSLIYTTLAISCGKEPSCSVHRIRGFRAADCSNRSFRNFPRCQRSNIEIFDLTMNRIKQLKTDELKNYPNLKKLYLPDNVLIKIEDNAFEDLTDLDTLDLSNNGLSKVPMHIFKLPSLMTLYLGQNMNMNIIESVEEAVPITCPLTQFDLSFNELETLPDMGLMPYLNRYNISGNNFTNLVVAQFSGLCNLFDLITTEVHLSLDQPCECWNINRWLKEKNVKFKPFRCQEDEKSCPPMEFSASDLERYDSCKKLKKELENKDIVVNKVLPAIGAILAIIVIVLIIVIWKRRKGRKLQKKQQETLLKNVSSG